MAKCIPVVLRMRTFGVDPRERYALPPRTHRGGPPLKRASVISLYHALRGEVIAARLAAINNDDRNLPVTLVTMPSPLFSRGCVAAFRHLGTGAPNAVGAGSRRGGNDQSV